MVNKKWVSRWVDRELADFMVEKLNNLRLADLSNPTAKQADVVKVKAELLKRLAKLKVKPVEDKGAEVQPAGVRDNPQVGDGVLRRARGGGDEKAVRDTEGKKDAAAGGRKAVQAAVRRRAGVKK